MGLPQWILGQTATNGSKLRPCWKEIKEWKRNQNANGADIKATGTESAHDITEREPIFLKVGCCSLTVG